MEDTDVLRRQSGESRRDSSDSKSSRASRGPMAGSLPRKLDHSVPTSDFQGDGSEHLSPNLHGTRDPFADRAEGLVRSEIMSENVKQWFEERQGRVVQGALAFVPWILQQAYYHQEEDTMRLDTVIHRGEGAMVFSYTSGFAELAEKLAKKSNGAEMLSQCLAEFFGELITTIDAYRGDVIKFSGGGLTVYFPDFDDTACDTYRRTKIPPHGSYDLPDLDPMAVAVLRASACCIEIHKRFHDYDTKVDGVKLSLKNGVGCGRVHVLQVGGRLKPPEVDYPRYEYMIAGPPLKQIAEAERLAKIGTTCLSPEAWFHVEDCAEEGTKIPGKPMFHLLAGLDAEKYTYPTIKHTAMMFDCRQEYQFLQQDLPIIRRFIPSFVFKQIECGTLAYVNEMRNVAVVFIQVKGLDVMSHAGAEKAQELMHSIQKCCYQHEGTVNKFLMDDQGLLFHLVYGLPPLVHTDDPTRAVLACFDIAQELKFLDLEGKFAVTTGRSYCGLYGSSNSRMEYTVLGDCVKLGARLLEGARPGAIICDEETKNRATSEIIWYAMAPMKVKGSERPVNIFCPERKPQAELIGLIPIPGSPPDIHFPWYDNASLSTHCDKAAFRKNAFQLCSLKTWEGIVKVQKLLGGSFDSLLYENCLQDSDGPMSPVSSPLRGRGQNASRLESSSAPPDGSPFKCGGVVVIESEAGMGKIELAEHIAVHSLFHFQMVPVFATMGPRPCGSTRMASELLRSILGAHRHLDPSLPSDDAEALEQVLEQVIPNSKASVLPMLVQAVREQSPDWEPRRLSRDSHASGRAMTDSLQLRRGGNNVSQVLSVAGKLLSHLAQHTPILIVMKFDHGTTRFPRPLEEDLDAFWYAVDRLDRVVHDAKDAAKKNPSFCPICMLLLVKEINKDSPAVSGCHDLLRLDGLEEENLLQYMSIYMGVAPETVDKKLAQLVNKVTSGNPLHVRETVDELQRNHLRFIENPLKQVTRVECIDLRKIDISSWQHTAMVSDTVSLLESLDPLGAAIVKMSLCFEGAFTLTDLAARACSRWAGATRLDRLLLYKEMLWLVNKNFIEEVRADSDFVRPVARTSHLSDQTRSSALTQGRVPRYRMRNLLMRSVGSSMVLAAEKKAVKRQALIDRVLQDKLPARMQELDRRATTSHVPWFYKQGYTRMAAEQARKGKEANPEGDDCEEEQRRGCSSM